MQMVRLRAASQGQVADAFGVDLATLWRWDHAMASGDVAGLVPARRGPKGSSKLTPGVAARIAELDAAGQTPRQIAVTTGCRRSLSGLRWAGSGREAWLRRPPTVTRAGAAGMAGETPRPRMSRYRFCRCCLIRCPGMGSGRWPGGGCSARAPGRRSSLVPGTAGRAASGLPRWRPPGCWRAARHVHGRLRDGFHGLAATLLTLVPLAIAESRGRRRHQDPARGAGPGARPDKRALHPQDGSRPAPAYPRVSSTAVITPLSLARLLTQLTRRSAFGYRNAADAAIMPG